MRRVMYSLVLLSVLALTAFAHADIFDFSVVGSGGGFSGSGMMPASSNGDGSYTVISISGTGVGGLIGPGLFDHNDNLLFPTSDMLVDGDGFAFTDTQGDTGFTVDIFSTAPDDYFAYFLDSDGFSATIPVTFSLNDITTQAPPLPIGTAPEPSSFILLASGIIAAGALARRSNSSSPCRLA